MIFWGVLSLIKAPILTHPVAFLARERPLVDGDWGVEPYDMPFEEPFNFRTMWGSSTKCPIGDGDGIW